MEFVCSFQFNLKSKITPKFRTEDSNLMKVFSTVKLLIGEVVIKIDVIMRTDYDSFCLTKIEWESIFSGPIAYQIGMILLKMKVTL